MARKSLQAHVPMLKFKDSSNESWTTTGNTHTISDPDIKENSLIFIQNVGAYNGRWRISSISNGSCVITSSDSETSGTTFKYLIL